MEKHSAGSIPPDNEGHARLAANLEGEMQPGLLTRRVLSTFVSKASVVFHTRDTGADRSRSFRPGQIPPRRWAFSVRSLGRHGIRHGTGPTQPSASATAARRYQGNRSSSSDAPSAYTTTISEQSGCARVHRRGNPVSRSSIIVGIEVCGNPKSPPPEIHC